MPQECSERPLAGSFGDVARVVAAGVLPGWILSARPCWTTSSSAARSWGSIPLLQVTLPRIGTCSVRMYSRTHAGSGVTRAVRVRGVGERADRVADRRAGQHRGLQHRAVELQRERLHGGARGPSTFLSRGRHHRRREPAGRDQQRVVERDAELARRACSSRRRRSASRSARRRRCAPRARRRWCRAAGSPSAARAGAAAPGRPRPRRRRPASRPRRRSRWRRRVNRRNWPGSAAATVSVRPLADSDASESGIDGLTPRRRAPPLRTASGIVRLLVTSRSAGRAAAATARGP